MWYRRIAIAALVVLGPAFAFAPDVRAQGERYQSSQVEWNWIPVLQSLGPPRNSRGSCSSRVDARKTYSRATSRCTIQEDLPDDPNFFFEEYLQIVSVDSSSVLRTHATTVDLGALPATTRVAGLKSFYGLAIVGPFSSRTLNFPVLHSTFALFTGLAFLNLGIDEAALELYAFDPVGLEYDAADNDGVLFLGLGEQLPRVASELFDFPTSNNEGWVQVYSDTPDVVGFELLGNAVVLDGVDVKASLTPTVVLTRIEYDNDRSTEIHVGNPTIFDNPVEVELWTSSGIVETYETTLEPKEKEARRIEDLFPGLTKGFLGYAIVRGDFDISAVELLVRDESMAALNGQALVTGSSVPEQLYSAQLATGGGAFETRQNVVNPTGLPAGLSVRAVGENGLSLAPAVSVQLGPGEQWEREIGQLFGFDSNVLTVGAMVIESSITGLRGDVAFGDPSSARAFRASLLLDARPARTAAFAQVANGAGFFTGVAAFNPNGAAAFATFAANGSLTGSGSLILPVEGRVSKLLPKIVASSAGQRPLYLLAKNRSNPRSTDSRRDRQPVSRERREQPRQPVSRREDAHFRPIHCLRQW